jgi:hypothetical protein
MGTPSRFINFCLKSIPAEGDKEGNGEGGISFHSKKFSRYSSNKMFLLCFYVSRRGFCCHVLIEKLLFTVASSSEMKFISLGTLISSFSIASAAIFL